MVVLSRIFMPVLQISVYILSEIPIRLSNLFYNNSFIFVDVNVNVENVMHSDLVMCCNFINYEMLTAFDFHFIGFASFQLLHTDIAPESTCSSNHCFGLVFTFTIMFPRMFLRNKHKKVKALFECIIFLLSITKSTF